MQSPIVPQKNPQRIGHFLDDSSNLTGNVAKLALSQPLRDKCEVEREDQKSLLNADDDMKKLLEEPVESLQGHCNKQNQRVINVGNDVQALNAGGDR